MINKNEIDTNIKLIENQRRRRKNKTIPNILPYYQHQIKQLYHISIDHTKLNK